MNYAQLDENNKCYAIISTDFEDAEMGIPVPEYDEKYLEATYLNGEWTNLSTKAEPIGVWDKMNVLANAMTVTNEPSDKLGFNWRITRLGEAVITREYIPIEGGANGTADNPFIWAEGIELIPNAYYLYNGVRFVWMGPAGVSDTPPVDDGGNWAEF